MGIGNKTFESVISTVATFITDECYNLNRTKFNSLPVYFTSYNELVYAASIAQDQYYQSTCRIAIDPSTAITFYDTSKTYEQLKSLINTDITNFVKNEYGSNLNRNITVPEFIEFFNTIVDYCSRYLRYVTSQFSSDPKLIWIKDGSASVYTKQNDDFIYAKQMTDIISVLKNKLSEIVRSKPVKYIYTMNNTGA